MQLSGDAPKILGIQWHPATDSFRFECDNWSDAKRITKRTLASDAAKLFDPLGLLGP